MEDLKWFMKPDSSSPTAEDGQCESRLHSVLVQEIGYALDLSYSSNDNAVLRPFYEINVVTLSNKDINNIMGLKSPLVDLAIQELLSHSLIKIGFGFLCNMFRIILLL
ncbi:hypothetical protein HZH66_013694 [Vespula vulgaris]|uniref:Peptidase M10 metallopeptidase domain-containing protein n=1 Tax=Vespula vulgaris TaxID=7454 RepID=A0A834MR35_VESVU|nr:hypothetical protein HZH66_013694 [Vespula vulgaris]